MLLCTELLLRFLPLRVELQKAGHTFEWLTMPMRAAVVASAGWHFGLTAGLAYSLLPRPLNQTERWRFVLIVGLLLGPTMPRRSNFATYRATSAEPSADLAFDLRGVRPLK
jgi:hypothetical protein